MSPDTFNERVAVIVGSTRPTRICPGIAERSQRTLSEQSPLRYRSIDLAAITTSATPTTWPPTPPSKPRPPNTTITAMSSCPDSSAPAASPSR
jgi:hypothetical protein